MVEETREEVLARHRAEVSRAHDRYRTGAEGMDVQEDQEAREAMAAESKTVFENDDDGTTLNSEPGVWGTPVYTGGNVVKVASQRAGSDGVPDDAQKIEDLEHEVLVFSALDAGDLFDKGGQIPPEDYIDETSVSDYVDPAWLAEASKMTAEKFF